MHIGQLEYLVVGLHQLEMETKMKTLAAWKGCSNKECKSEKCKEGDNCKCTTENPCEHCK